MTQDSSTASHPRLGHQMVSGTLWMVAMRWVIRLIGLVNTAIIARMLVPEDFGVVALAMIVVDLLVTITDGDIEMALVRSTDARRSLNDTGWTLKIIAALLTFCALWGLAPWVADYFGDARIATVVRIAALRPLILGFENIEVVEFRRSLRFSAEFRYLVIQRLGTFVAGLGLVFALHDYLALAWALPLSAVITVGLSFWIVPSHPRLSLAHWRELWLFSRWQMLFNSARLVGERCDQFIISRLASLVDTGVYVVGFDLALMPSREIMLPAGRALLPAYAKLAHNPDEMRASFRTVLGFAAIIAAAAGVGMSLVSEDAVYLILGRQWSTAVPFVQWLGIFGALEGMWLMLDPFLIAARHERALAVSNLAFSVFTIPVVALSAALFGISAIPVGRIGVMAVILGAVFARMIQWKWISLRNLLKVLWRPVLSALLMACAVHAGHRAVFSSQLPSLFADMAVGGTSYSASLLGLWYLSGRPEGAERILTEQFAERFHSLVRAWKQRRQR